MLSTMCCFGAKVAGPNASGTVELVNTKKWKTATSEDVVSAEALDIKVLCTILDTIGSSALRFRWYHVTCLRNWYWNGPSCSYDPSLTQAILSHSDFSASW